MKDKNLRLRELPAVDLVLREIPYLVEEYGHQQVTESIRVELLELRENISAGTDEIESNYIQHLVEIVGRRLQISSRPSLIPVINLSGTILHTNLGRALLPQGALDAVMNISRSASNLEYDLNEGRRGDRDSHIDELICELTGAEAATVVNNNAAAVLLTLNTLGKGKEVPVSRGELVEIGGSFRMPEIITSAGCHLLEVGTTNRTHLKDFSNAINDNTAMLLKVHTSNYRIEGFVSEVSEKELAQLARDHDLPFVIDLGSGNLIDYREYSLPNEPTVRQVLNDGADLVTFSGDKLLGGPQCGIIAGKKELIAQIKSNPLKRALRIDKMTLAALTEVLRLYQNTSLLKETLPTLAYLTRPVDDIREQANRLESAVVTALPEYFEVSTGDCESQVGSGALPTAGIPSFALLIKAQNKSDESLRTLAAAMRRLPMPVIGRIHKGSYLLDLRCLDDEEAFTEQLKHLSSLLN